MKKGLDIKQIPRDHPSRIIADIWRDARVELTVKGEILTFWEKVMCQRG